MICNVLDVIKKALKSFQQHDKNKHSKGSQSRNDMDTLVHISIDSRHFESLSSSSEEEDYDINEDSDSDGVAEPICKKRKKNQIV